MDQDFDLRMAAVTDDDGDDDIGELQVAEYILLVLGLDTYLAHLQDVAVNPDTDSHTRKGIQLVRRIDSQSGDSIKKFLHDNNTREVSQRSILRTFQVNISNPEQASRRALTLRTALNRGGPATLKSVFADARARKEVKLAIAAHMLENPAVALTKYAAIPIQNFMVKSWVRKCVDLIEDGSLAQEEVALSTSPSSPVESAASAVADRTKELKTQQMLQEGTAHADALQETQARQSDTLTQVQQDATAAAAASLQAAGEEDAPPARSEVVGIATAAAVAALAEAGNQENVPTSLRRLDPEQRAAALTDGRVLVAAGAGAGKSTTLVSRVRYLVEERGVDPSRILVSSFNKKAALELENKIGTAIGGEAAKTMTVGTLHATFKRAITKYGTPEEKAMFDQGFVGTGSKVASAINRVWRKCFAAELGNGELEDAKAPPAKSMMMYKTKWSGNGVSPAEAMAKASSEEEVQAARWYEWYMGFKGDLGPNWAPSCHNRVEAKSEWDRFIKLTRTRDVNGRPTRIRLGDFDDMITVFKGILKRSPDVRQRLHAAYDHVLIDECQDLNEEQSEVLSLMTEHIGDGTDGKSFWMIGDDKQCVAADTEVSIGKGETRKASDLRPGDMVLSYRNGDLVEQRVAHVMPSGWTWGYKVTTDSGRTLTMSPNHKLWAQAPVLADGEVSVYLMYRRDKGFRVGITNKCHAEDYLNSFGGRAFLEKAERMWILKVCSDREVALLEETRLSLKYGVPTAVFEGEHRGLNQGRLDALFDEFGQNGASLLEAQNLDFDLPHWMSQSYTKHGRTRRTVQMIAHSSSGTQVTLEWSGDDLDSKLSGVRFKTTSTGTRRVRRWFNNYRDALEFAQSLAQKTDAILSRRLSTPEGALRLVTAAGIFKGSLVPVEDNGLVLEQVVSVEKVDATFVDLDVDNASNFFGGGILSHNSIYAFRGARPDLFTGLDGKEGWKTRVIRTNYRCPPEIVEGANRLISHNTDQIPMEANPAPGRTRGEASIRVDGYIDEAQTAMAVAMNIKTGLESDATAVSDNAILCRTNKELHSFETALLLKGIPYARKGASSFLGSPETKSFLGYVDLATGDDFESMQDALVDILNKPNRFFASPDQCKRAVDYALGNYARREGLSKKGVNPTVALRDRDFQEDVIYILKGDRGGFKARKGLEQLDRLVDALNDLQLLASDKEATTKDLFDEVLKMPGIKFDIDPHTGKIRGEKEVTFVEELQASLADFGSGDDDDVLVEEEEGNKTSSLGNVSFLYELAKVDPQDPGDLEVPPTTPHGFWAKMKRFQEKAKELRIDITAWDKAQDALPPEERKPPPGVYLGTVHSTKGAQWPSVYLQMMRGRFPMVPRVEPGEIITPGREAEMAAEMESERRLAYVAMTRPSRNLSIVYPASFGGKAAGASPFIGEANYMEGENIPKHTPVEEAPPPGPVPGNTKTAEHFIEDVPAHHSWADSWTEEVL